MDPVNAMQRQRQRALSNEAKCEQRVAAASNVVASAAVRPKRHNARCSGRELTTAQHGKRASAAVGAHVPSPYMPCRMVGNAEIKPYGMSGRSCATRSNEAKGTGKRAGHYLMIQAFEVPSARMPAVRRRPSTCPSEEQRITAFGETGTTAPHQLNHEPTPNKTHNANGIRHTTTTDNLIPSYSTLLWKCLKKLVVGWGNGGMCGRRCAVRGAGGKGMAGEAAAGSRRHAGIVRANAGSSVWWWVCVRSGVEMRCCCARRTGMARRCNGDAFITAYAHAMLLLFFLLLFPGRQAGGRIVVGRHSSPFIARLPPRPACRRGAKARAEGRVRSSR